ncbi:hypothetical protein QJS04_geneDACA006784 [Acorus gramineus]|uniref:Trichome birefringence-like N-terminal domain-containing protein n=1 Tax=Acorus gramineus TaxID=55184 RepID=A0AAV9AXN1_ACOGR|nr:hypothetical protein QJS04_geneDACA006784 [Acorus gramineus]
MKLHEVDISIGKRRILHKILNILLLGISVFIILVITHLYYYPLINPSFLQPPPPPYAPATPSIKAYNFTRATVAKDCDIFKGEWTQDPNAPYYTNETCWTIQEHQNCMKFGRPDTDYLRWRWKPKDCDLPLFDPLEFLKIVRGKSMAFVGDSLGRNQMQSLLCLLARVEYPKDVSYTSDENFKRWSYTSYDFTVASFWSPFLVKARDTNPKGLYNLYLDKPDSAWVKEIEKFDYVIMSAGNWFSRPAMLYEKGKLTGSNYYLSESVSVLTEYYAPRKAFRTAFRALVRMKGFKGTIFLRTVAPSHFENGQWNTGGNCVRTVPFQGNEIRFKGYDLQIYRIQTEEFRKAERDGRRRKLKFRLLDVTRAMLLRPDGHPSRYGHWPEERITIIAENKSIKFGVNSRVAVIGL